MGKGLSCQEGISRHDKARSSAKFELTSGVPQGYLLARVLFLLFEYDIKHFIADDANMVVPAGREDISSYMGVV